MSNLTGARILVTGGTGFLGSRVVHELEHRNAEVYQASRTMGYDLRDESEALTAFLVSKPDIVIHLAAVVGSVGTNEKFPGSMFRDNVQIGMNVIHASAVAHARLIVVGDASSYPEDVKSPLKESDFFTYAKADGKDLAFGDAKDYSLDYKSEVLTLHFTLPLKTPVKGKDLSIEVYDPSYFVDFSFLEKDAVALVGAPTQCKVALEKPKDTSVAQSSKPMSESYFANMNMGANFATKIAVKCP